ncbi:hypothetical protein BJ508DRAFT_341328 [Ascobolus immersus RN42]|uniref:Uncharacterized protein n=1 Tax=Ascobolus immersus RN42 TaxID=1160509 RepID=A0A3N4HLJ3_ASCIM|nr:hypothetical protein BJ508DRAFT_341328 [Ascobolus immersus RN42]
MEQKESGWTTVNRKACAALKKTEREKRREIRTQSAIKSGAKRAYESESSRRHWQAKLPPIGTSPLTGEYWARVAAVPKLPDDRLAYLTHGIKLVGFEAMQAECLVEELREHFFRYKNIVVVDFVWVLYRMRWYCFRGEDGLMHIVTFDYDYVFCLGEMEEGIEVLRSVFVEKARGADEN